MYSFWPWGFKYNFQIKNRYMLYFIRFLLVFFSYETIVPGPSVALNLFTMSTVWSYSASVRICRWLSRYFFKVSSNSGTGSLGRLAWKWSVRRMLLCRKSLSSGAVLSKYKKKSNKSKCQLDHKEEKFRKSKKVFLWVLTPISFDIVNKCLT